MSKAGEHSEIDRVRDATDLVKLIGEHVALKPRGREHVGLCPFHDDRSPSMAVVTHKGNSFFKCHACGAGGDAFAFVQKYHRMEFGEALRYLAQRAGVVLTPWKRDESNESGSPRRIDLKKANAFAAAFFRRTLNDQTHGAVARATIASRSVSSEMAEAFQIGAAPESWDGLLNRVRKQGLPLEPFVQAGLLKARREGSATGHYDAFRNRLMFPICDELGSPIAFGARRLNAEDEPKYLNSSESSVFSKSRTLYGLHLAKRAIIEQREAVVTEGYTDVIACHQAGFANTVATLGTALTRDHARILSKLCDSVILLFDGDEAGMKAADRALEVFFAEAVDIRICVLPDGCDPDELLRQADGSARFKAALESATDALDYKIARFCLALRDGGVNTLSGRQKKFEGLLQELSELGVGALQGVRRHLVISRLSEIMAIPVSTIDQLLAQSRSKSRVSNEGRELKPHHAMEPDQCSVNADGTSRARVVAEHDVLALIVYEPKLSLHFMKQSSESRFQASSVLAAERFSDAAVRAIALHVRSWFECGSEFTVQQLLAGLECESHRNLVTNLYFVGERLAGAKSASFESALCLAIESLEHCMWLESWKHTLMAAPRGTDSEAHRIDPLAHLKSVIEQRRIVDRDSAAIAEGVRN